MGCSGSKASPVNGAAGHADASASSSATTLLKAGRMEVKPGAEECRLPFDIAQTRSLPQQEHDVSSPVHLITHVPSEPVMRERKHLLAASPAAAGESATSSGAREDFGQSAAQAAQSAPKRRDRPARTLPASMVEASTANGFKAIPEIPSLSCSEDFLAAYSLPGEVWNYTPPADAVVTQFKNGDSERKIHLNIELTESELDRLTHMRQEAKTIGAEFYPSVAAMATRFLSRARMDPKKAVKLMKATQEWRAEYFKGGPVSSDEVAEDMKHGIVYFTGRDSCMRPAMVIRAARIPQQWYADRCVHRFIRMLIFCMEYFTRYMVVPGKIENLSVIVDMQGLGIGQVPLGPLSEVYGVMSHHYIGRVYKFYVCNVSYVLGSIAGMAKSILTDRQKQKLNMLSNVNELRKDFALHQLEEDLGGSRKVLTEFFPFPLQPGPFVAGCSEGPCSGAVPDAHDVLSQVGAIGKLWNPKLSAKENKRLEYGPRAMGILERCGAHVPADVRCEHGASLALLYGTSMDSEGSRVMRQVSVETDPVRKGRGGAAEGLMASASASTEASPDVGLASFEDEDEGLQAAPTEEAEDFTVAAPEPSMWRGLACCQVAS